MTVCCEKEVLILTRLARYLLRRVAECENKGGNARVYHHAFHLTVKVLHGVLTGRINAENLVPLMMFLDKSAFGGIMRLDSAKRKSQKGGGRGHGQWVTIHGTHIFIDNSGTVTKGPPKFVGLSVSEAMSQSEMSGGHGSSSNKPEVKANPHGRNKSCTGFKDQAAEQRHKKHWKEFGFTSNVDYVNHANHLFTQPTGGNIDGYARPDGAIVRYDMTTGGYVAGVPGGTLYTYFKPRFSEGKVNLSDAYAYYERHKKEEDGI